MGEFLNLKQNDVKYSEAIFNIVNTQLTSCREASRL